MGKLHFRDFDEFAAAIEGIAGQFIPTARSASPWWIEGTAVGRLSLQQVQTGGAFVFSGTGESGKVTLNVPLTAYRKIRIDGLPLEPGCFMLLDAYRPFTWTVIEGVSRWGTITLPDDHVAVAPALQSTRCADATVRWRTHVDFVDRLRKLTHALAAMKAADSSASAHRAAEEEISSVVARALEPGIQSANGRHLGRPPFSRDRVVARTLELIEANEGQPLFVSDLCRAAQVSERTLRNVFNEYFGVGPMRLLKVRQLRQVHAALLRADPQHDTVSHLAAHFGVWDFPGFSRNYKALFGESPSTTLRTRPKGSSRHNVRWLNYAATGFLHDRLQVLGTQPAETADE